MDQTDGQTGAVSRLLRAWGSGDLQARRPGAGRLPRTADTGWRISAEDDASHPHGFVPYANVTPAFDDIRDDPRFKALVARLKLPG